jgi:hypothetical protein
MMSLAREAEAKAAGMASGDREVDVTVLAL